jgi:hypothetical protein
MVGMRTFVLQRDVDATGISGTGVVAEGVAFSDGTVAVRWLGPIQQKWGLIEPTTVLHPNIENVTNLHGHNGQTKVVWGSSTDLCKHCGRVIGSTRRSAGWTHLDGGQKGLGRCHSDDSGLSYGYNAEPADEPCSIACKGSNPMGPDGKRMDRPMTDEEVIAAGGAPE